MIRNTFKVILCSIGCLILSAVAIAINETIVLPLYLSVLQIFPVLVAVIATLSIAFFTYTDNIEQKLSELYKKYNECKLDQAHESIGALKKEILLNVTFILILFISEKFISGVPLENFIFIIAEHKIEGNLVGSVCRMAMLLLALLVFIDQIRAFISAIQYRQVVSKGIGK